MRTRTARLAAMLVTSLALTAAWAGAASAGTFAPGPWGAATPLCPAGLYACGPAV